MTVAIDQLPDVARITECITRREEPLSGEFYSCVIDHKVRVSSKIR
jgi:hypothetical protein